MSEKRGVVRKKKRWGKTFEYTPISRKAVLDEDTLAEVEKDLKKLKPVTAESFANKHGIRVGLAKKILESQVEEGKIKRIHKGQVTSIYSA